MSSFLDQILSPFLGRGKWQRTEAQQQALNRAMAGMALYHFPSCPFCIKTRMAIRRLGLKLELKNINQDPQAHRALLEGGGRTTVPCLRIDDGAEVIWMYESADIIRYLNQLAKHQV